MFLCTVEDSYEGEPYSHEIKVKGKAYSLDINGLYILTGEYAHDDRYGPSYQIISFCKQCNWTDAAHQRQFLESLFTDRQVEAMYEALPNPYKTIQDSDVSALCTVKGIGNSTATRMIEKFRHDFDKSRAYVVLGKYDLSTTLIDGLIRRFGGDIDAMLYTIDTNPYIMMFEIDGIGWKKADQLALAKGIQLDDLVRIEANIQYQLTSITEQGHTWVTPAWLVENVLSACSLPADKADRFREALYELNKTGVLWWDEGKTKIALSRLRRMEEDIAKELYRIANGELLTPRTQETPSELLSQIEVSQGWNFTDEQKQAINGILKNNVCIITGAAGTGKSSVVSGVLHLLQGYGFAQCALSGRAAARLTEVTHKEGSTIHRLLGYSYGKFLYDCDNHLPYDIIILDEISMVGADIFYSLIRAIRTGTKLIMLGDEGQLESIGLCNIFKDMLDSGVIPAARLTQIHRQAAKSAIITESTKVRRSEPLAPHDWIGAETRGELQDLHLVVYGNPILSQDTVIEQYRNLLQQGIDYCDIQVVVPMKFRGDISTLPLNRLIQNIVNPPRHDDEGVLIGAIKGTTDRAYHLRQRDRVIVTKNMYQAVRASHDIRSEDNTMPDICPVYNGDRGIIKRIDNQMMIITFDQWGDIIIKRGDYPKIELGYALSCHKLQGSEANYVIVGLDMGSRVLLTKEWLYTAITRAKKYCVLCAENKALSFAVQTSNISIKQTMLKGLLRDTFLVQ